MSINGEDIQTHKWRLDTYQPFLPLKVFPWLLAVVICYHVWPGGSYFSAKCKTNDVHQRHLICKEL